MKSLVSNLLKRPIPLFLLLLASAMPAAFGEKINMSAVRSITNAMWNEASLTPEEKQKVEAAQAAALKDPEVVTAMASLAEVRKEYQANQDKFPNDRDKTIGSKYRAAGAAATQAFRKAFLAADPSLASLLDRPKAKKNEGENETDSDTGNKAAVAPIEDVPGLPRVLLIGDSISIGYTLQVRALLRDKANVHRIPINGGATEVGLENMKEWLGDKPYDVIHFNFGLHDAKYASATEQRASREVYIQHLQQLIDQMKATGAKLVFATTTPIPEKLMFGKATGNRVFDSIPERNALAVELMKKNGVAVNDLYALVLPIQEKIGRPGDVHYGPEGYDVIAKAVAASVEAQLPAKKASE